MTVDTFNTCRGLQRHQKLNVIIAQPFTAPDVQHTVEVAPSSVVSQLWQQCKTYNHM